MALSFPTAPFVTGRPTLSAARARLADVQQVSRWAALVLRESEQWEDATLAREEAQPGPPAHPAYPY